MTFKLVKRIISGGQTGADLGGLRAAKSLGIPTGGYVPKGYRTENGSNPDLKNLYGLIETSSWQYPERTIRNIVESDLTIIFSARNSPGSNMTRSYCIERAKPHLMVNPYKVDIDFVRSFIERISEKISDSVVINIAGNRERRSPGIEDEVEKIVVKILS